MRFYRYVHFTNKKTDPLADAGDRIWAWVHWFRSVFRTTRLWYDMVDAVVHHVTSGYHRAQRRDVWPSAWQVWGSETQGVVSSCASVFSKMSYLERRFKGWESGCYLKKEIRRDYQGEGTAQQRPRVRSGIWCWWEGWWEAGEKHLSSGPEKWDSMRYFTWSIWEETSRRNSIAFL